MSMSARQPGSTPPVDRSASRSGLRSPARSCSRRSRSSSRTRQLERRAVAQREGEGLDQLQKNAEVMTNTHLEELLVGQPADVKAEIIHINTIARPRALQIALIIPLLAALLGLINGFRMTRLPGSRAVGCGRERARRLTKTAIPALRVNSLGSPADLRLSPPVDLSGVVPEHLREEAVTSCPTARPSRPRLCDPAPPATVRTRHWRRECHAGSIPAASIFAPDPGQMAWRSPWPVGTFRWLWQRDARLLGCL